MNVMFLNSIAADVYGGVEHWIGMVSCGLVGRGHRISAIGRPDSEFLRRTKLAEPSCDTIELDISSDINPVTIARIKKELSRRKIDITVVNFNKDIRLGGLASKLGGSARIVWRVGVNLTRDTFVHRFLTPKLIDGVITPSRSLKAQITKLGYIPESLVEVIPTGIADTKLKISRAEAKAELCRKYALPQDSIIAVTSGRFVRQKGHKYLVEAASEIVARFSTVRFLLLGDGPLEQTLREQIAASNLTERFVFAGLLDDFELELAGSDIMLHPAIIEPFGIVLAEGMRAGLAAVATRVDGIPEVVREGETALLVEPEKAHEFATAAIHLLSSQDRMAEYGKAARARWQGEFSYDVMINHVESYLQSVVAGENVHA